MTADAAPAQTSPAAHINFPPAHLLINVFPERRGSERAEDQIIK